MGNGLRIWVNGEIVPGDEAVLPVLDRGWLYGDGLFETLRAYNGRPHLLEAHCARLARSCRALGLPPPPDRSVLEQAVRDLVARNNAPEAYVRITLTRGPGGRGPLPPPSGAPTVAVVVRPLDPYPPLLFRRGVSAVRARAARHASMRLPRHKTTSYMTNVLERQRAEQRGAREALFTDTEGNVLEGSVSNVFLVQTGRLVTPHADAPLLPGVTRARVLELARAAGVPAAEESVPWDRLAKADEAFLTNAIMEILPLVRIEGKPIGAGAPGAVTKRLRELYREDVEAARELGRVTG
jgi:aminodeoxychorismate lyase